MYAHVLTLLLSLLLSLLQGARKCGHVLTRLLTLHVATVSGVPTLLLSLLLTYGLYYCVTYGLYYCVDLCDDRAQGNADARLGAQGPQTR